MALSALVAAEPTAEQKLADIRRYATIKRKPSGKDRTKVKAARKQRQKSKR
jgi:hypothetical protein